MTNTFQQAPFLRNQRDFPSEDVKALAVQSDRAYIEVATAVNNRSIGTYATNVNIVNGKSWVLSGPNTKQQGLQRVYTFSGGGTYPHNLNWASISQISPFTCGSYTDGSAWYGAIYSSFAGIPGQVVFWIDSTNINILVDSKAPPITSIIIALDWVSVV